MGPVSKPADEVSAYNAHSGFASPWRNDIRQNLADETQGGLHATYTVWCCRDHTTSHSGRVVRLEKMPRMMTGKNDDAARPNAKATTWAT